VKNLLLSRRLPTAAFSLVEVLAAIAIIGIITFLAIPNIVSIKEDGERNLAISRAEALNMATVAYYQKGGAASVTAWGSANNAQRYVLVAPYLAYAPATLAAYLPSGYGVTLPTSLPPSSKASLVGPDSASIPY